MLSPQSSCFLLRGSSRSFSQSRAPLTSTAVATVPAATSTTPDAHSAYARLRRTLGAPFRADFADAPDSRKQRRPRARESGAINAGP